MSAVYISIKCCVHATEGELVAASLLVYIPQKCCVHTTRGNGRRKNVQTLDKERVL